MTLTKTISQELREAIADGPNAVTPDLLERAAAALDAHEPNGDGWRPPITAPPDRDCLFSLRPLTKDDPYFVDTSGNPILGKGQPRVIMSRYGRWSSLEVMTGWLPIPQPLNRSAGPSAPLACACIGCARKPKHGECECGMNCNCRCKLGPLSENRSAEPSAEPVDCAKHVAAKCPTCIAAWSGFAQNRE